ncbi:MULTISPECIES: type VI secretion system Vgr family protein [Mesorhizobium]|uniref:Type VI secretion system secreted protein VgrG n=1 Tax=Mesorhizobium qingshengii TaxID=1165689 RepID=A0A1G5ZXQ3_9HYPH|nr:MULTISPECIES: type VI secretion system tip protein TssI/VgrG [Mesorhizobium]MCH4561116.1 type VI secretion system tip protein VgrG [Mesorhizobium jarvisii]QGU21142.1 type VI secretion system tip protein VgrG [Mesorhizobium huakuii 7653R]SDA99538.1 type VI secretion system secreted protein VgrG [Mesorhizobium qingshengii]
MVQPTIETLLKHNRFAAVTSAALQPNDIILRRLRGTERLGEPFHYEVKIATPNPVQNFADVPGQFLTVGLKLKDAGTRFFNGVITRFEYLGLDDTEHLNYVAELRPWLSLLDYRINSRIFQNKTSIEVIMEIFREHKGNIKNRTIDGVPKRTFCVQYDETDLAFVSRLMEQDGLYYYFEHGENRHDLVLVDNLSSHDTCKPEAVETHHNLRATRNLHRDDVILHWNEVVSLRSNKVVLKDYDNEKPMAELTAVARAPSVRIGGIPPAKSGMGAAAHVSGAPVMSLESSTANVCSATQETFIYPGGYKAKRDGDFYATIRAEELACNAYRARIETTARHIETGLVFKASNPFHYGDVSARPTATQRFLAIATEFTVLGEVGDRTTGTVIADQSAESFLYHSTLEIIPASTQYRPVRHTPVPVIKGPQTAVVVGPRGETITTDQYGRIKVQFFWDREGNKDENSSCWVRVAQNWAGKGFGCLLIPRIGQEVVVDFVHGDPDRPLVTGVVYNGSNLPPENLPANKSRSTFRTHTDRGTIGDYNELRFEDRQGSEEVFLKAQKDHIVEVGNNYAIEVKKKYLLTSATAGSSFGSSIEVTTDKIRLSVLGATGPQAIEISEAGITLLNGQGASIQMSGPSVIINNGALVVT